MTLWRFLSFKYTPDNVQKRIVTVLCVVLRTTRGKVVSAVKVLSPHELVYLMALSDRLDKMFYLLHFCLLLLCLGSDTFSLTYGIRF